MRGIIVRAALTATVIPVLAFGALLSPVGGDERFVGIWEGPLQVGPMSLRIVVHINKADAGGLTASMDSPDQGATGIPATDVTIKDDDINFNVPSIMGEYDGELNIDGNQLTGLWKQRGVSLGLNLKKVDKPTEVIRPQHPKPPFPYDTQDVEYDANEAGVKLAGTLTTPRGDGPFPAVLLITGSGAQNRDEELFGHKPFLVLADHLTRKGIAVLRVDDRGVGKSTGSMKEATTEDFAGDALAGVAFLKTQKKIDAKRIGLCGHSEGGVIAPMAAARCKDVAFIVMMAGTGLPGEDILYMQGERIMRAEGQSAAEIERDRQTQRTIFAILKSEKNDETAQKKMHDELMTAFKALPEDDQKKLGDLENAAAAQIKPVMTKWFRFFLTYDPRTALREVKCPVLAINGELDLQVPARENLAEIEKTLRAAGNKNFKTQMIPGKNHLFQTATTGSPSEYGKIEETMSPEAMDVIAMWILGLK
ncbi:MAG: alpha/beta fold hydrolase [Phycisphaerae bacterium]